MPKWNGLEVPKLPRGVYLRKKDAGVWIRANAEEYPETYMNLADIWNGDDGWMVDFWKGGAAWETSTNVCETQQEALDYAVAMLWLGEVKYTLDEGRVDVRHEG